MSSAEESNSKQKKISRSAITRPYRIVSYIGMLLFVGLIAYIVYFQVTQSQALLNNDYNQRQNQADEQTVRGRILARDGSTVLAETTIDEDGNEVRKYPFGSLYAHTVGYQAYGGSGLEASQNKALIRSNSSLINQMQTDLEEEKKAGDDLVTSLDPVLQQTASDALGTMPGAALVMDVKTGKVLADVSNPSFDPNTVEEDWDSLTTDDRGILMNRGLQGLYAPGSTFKMVTALAYLRQYGTFDNFEYDCQGSWENAGFTIHCAGWTAHGHETFYDAMAYSCNCAFAYMAVNLIDKDNLRRTAEELGFNKDLDLQLPYTISSFTLDNNSPEQLYMQTAIGQGDTLATPMQMALIADAIANEGIMMKPTYVERVVASDKTVVSQNDGEEAGRVMSDGEANVLKSLLSGVTQYGTASDLGNLPYNIVGKTGTAEYGDIADGTAHSWFVGFSNTGNHDIVVCVLVEGGGNGVYSATPVAGQLFSTYFGG